MLFGGYFFHVFFIIYLGTSSLPESSLFDYMHSELRRGYFLENEEQRYTERREKFYMFMKIPRELEKVIENFIINITY